MSQVIQRPTRQDAEDLRDAIDAALGLPRVTSTHRGRYVQHLPPVVTDHECEVIDKPGNSPIAGVIMTPAALALDGVEVTHPRTGQTYTIEVGTFQDFDAGGWRPPQAQE